MDRGMHRLIFKIRGHLFAPRMHCQSSTERPYREAMNPPYGTQHYDGVRSSGGWRGNLSH